MPTIIQVKQVPANLFMMPPLFNVLPNQYYSRVDSCLYRAMFAVDLRVVQGEIIVNNQISAELREVPCPQNVACGATQFRDCAGDFLLCWLRLRCSDQNARRYLKRSAS